MRKSFTILVALLLVVQTFADTNNFSFSQAPTAPGIYLDSHSDKCFEKQIDVDKGLFKITFEYKIISKQNISRSSVFVLIDGNLVFKATPLESGKKIQIEGSFEAGKYVLAFCAQGNSNEPQHQVLISNLAVPIKGLENWQKDSQEIQSLEFNFNSVTPAKQYGTLGKDLIINGGFEKNKCQYDWCSWEKYSFKPEMLIGWTGGNFLEIGKNSFYYRPSLGSNFVALIEGFRKMFLSQKLPLTAGKYLLSFDWVSRYLKVYGAFTFSVKYNGKSLKNITLVDGCQSQKIEFTLEEDAPNGELVFNVGENTSALLDNIKLQKYQ